MWHWKRGVNIKREKAQIIEGFLSVFINGVLFVIKFWVGVTTGSIALVADAWHTMSDSLSSIFVVVAARLAARRPDKEHPFGHGRWELVASIFIAFLLGVIGYEFAVISVRRFQSGEAVMYGMPAIIATVVSIIIKELLAQYAFYIGRKYDNPVVSADGWHHRSDSLSSVVVLAGIVATRFFTGFWWMDSALGMFCALAIIYAAFAIMKDVVKRILGEEPKKEFVEQLDAEVKKLFDIDLKLHHLHLHNYVTQKELTLHMLLDKKMTIEEGHRVASVIEAMISERFDMAATIHVEPIEPVHCETSH